MGFTLSKSSPWPAENSNAVLFILDADNEFELQLLNQWLSAFKQQGGDSATVVSNQVILSLGSEQTHIDSGDLHNWLDVDDSTLVAPLRIAWLPNAEEIGDKLLFRHLIMGDPRRPSARKGRKILCAQPERVIPITGEPAHIGALKDRFRVHQQDDPDADKQAFADFIARQAGLALDLAERRLQGGRYKVPRYVADSLRANPKFKASIKELAEQEGKAVVAYKPALNEYIKEMVSVPTSFYIDVAAKFNNFVLGLGYEKDIVYDTDELARVRQIVRDHPSILLWTHKTYLDGMVMPKVLYDNDFPVPHMFGGANLGFFGLGTLLRRAGAIFIRRSFQDNPLYKLTLRYYIGYLMEKRFPLTWSFEGTRSRLGKLMPPRYGLLKYVLEACQTTSARDIYIIPVSISYDLIRDVDEYADEQTGRAKTAESLRWMFSYVSSLRKPMGRIYMNIGEPVVLDQAPDTDDRLALSKIALQVGVEANKVTPLTLPSLVCMSLLGNAPQALTGREALMELKSLLEWAEDRGITVSSDFDRKNMRHFLQLLDIMVGEGLLTRYDEGPEMVFGLAPDQHPRASYYRNSVIHFFVNKAIIELALLSAINAEQGQRVDSFFAEADRLRDLFKFEFFYAPSEEFRHQLIAELDTANADWRNRIAQGNNSIISLLGDMYPLVAHSTLLPFVEAYRVVADMLARLPASETMEQKPTVEKALKYGRQAYLQRRISSEASIGKILFENAFTQFSHQSLTDAGEASLEQNRKSCARNLHELSHRLERVRVISVALRDSKMDRDPF